jgi:hypothetical protein
VIYMLEVNVLVALIGFSLAGLVILARFAWMEAKKYAHALVAMRRLTVATHRESFVISRVNSRNADRELIRQP